MSSAWHQRRKDLVQLDHALTEVSTSASCIMAKKQRIDEQEEEEFTLFAVFVSVLKPLQLITKEIPKEGNLHFLDQVRHL